MYDLAYVVMYPRSTANPDSISAHIVLYSILYEQNVHVYSQVRLFLSYGQCPVPRCLDEGSLSVHMHKLHDCLNQTIDPNAQYIVIIICYNI